MGGSCFSFLQLAHSMHPHIYFWSGNNVVFIQIKTGYWAKKWNMSHSWPTCQNSLLWETLVHITISQATVDFTW